MGRMLVLVAGSLTGTVLGAILVAAVCSGLQFYAEVRFDKEPLTLILVLGVPVGGVLGALVGLWSVTYGDERQGPHDPPARFRTMNRRRSIWFLGLAVVVAFLLWHAMVISSFLSR
jgi:heme A synthase